MVDAGGGNRSSADADRLQRRCVTPSRDPTEASKSDVDPTRIGVNLIDPRKSLETPAQAVYDFLGQVDGVKTVQGGKASANAKKLPQYYSKDDSHVGPTSKANNSMRSRLISGFRRGANKFVPEKAVTGLENVLGRLINTANYYDDDDEIDGHPPSRKGFRRKGKRNSSGLLPKRSDVLRSRSERANRNGGLNRSFDGLEHGDDWNLISQAEEGMLEDELAWEESYKPSIPQDTEEMHQAWGALLEAHDHQEVVGEDPDENNPRASTNSTVPQRLSRVPRTTMRNLVYEFGILAKHRYALWKLWRGLGDENGAPGKRKETYEGIVDKLAFPTSVGSSSSTSTSGSHSENSDLIGPEVLKQIEMDIPRTLGKVLSPDEHYDKLRRILHVFCVRNPEVGYCQSMNVIVGVLIFVGFEEADALFLLEKVLEGGADWLSAGEVSGICPGYHEKDLKNLMVRYIII